MTCPAIQNYIILIGKKSVVPLSPVEMVGPFPTVNGVRIGFTINGVIASAAIYGVIASARKNRVIVGPISKALRPPIDVVVAVAAVEMIVAIAAIDNVGFVTPIEMVITVGTNKEVFAIEAKG